MAKVNDLGFDRKSYLGAKSTLCTGCGHDSITNHIISALFLSGISPYQVAKVSGIGCSSKTPTYFLNQSHGFNSLHGRMAPLAIGAKMANKNLQVLGVSGDGDSASIGLGGFVHLIRRNLPMVYILENNGIYGLTKGQFSATADPGSTQKSGSINPFDNIDLCSLAIESGCGFVARSFSGDAKQLVPLIKAALQHPGTAFIDVISPCVTFANHNGSTKSYDYIKEHKLSLHELDFIVPQENHDVTYEEGTVQDIPLANGAILRLKKIETNNYNPQSKMEALTALHSAKDQKEVLTGLIFYDDQKQNLVDASQLTETPLFQLNEEQCRLSKEQFSQTLKDFK